MAPLRTAPMHAAHWLPLIVVALVAGCGPAPISGGTPGLLTSDGNPIPDVQVAVYANAATDQRLGYGVTRADGTFELVTADGTAPLKLQPGSYVVTLESVGAPTDLPRTYLDAKSTPLKIDWTEADRLELNVPGLTLK